MQKLTLKNRKDQTIVGILEKPNAPIQGTCIVMHGHGGFKEQPYMQRLKDAFLEKGFITFIFDVTNSFGESDGHYEEARLGLHCEDLEDVVAWAMGQDWYKDPLALTGHSIGGHAAVRYAENNVEDVGFLAPIAPVVSGRMAHQRGLKNDPDAVAAWKESGWKKKVSRLKPGVVSRIPWDFVEERNNHDIVPHATSLQMPTLVYVGEKDPGYPPEDIKVFYDAIPQGNKKFVVAPGAGHTYYDKEHIEHLYATVSQWLDENLAIQNE